MNQAEVDALVQAFRNRFGPQVEAEAVNGHGRYRFAVVSPQFASMTHLQRQDALWEVVDATLPRPVTLDISLILAFAPNELVVKD
jgi:stress-induced morphogen